jgi:hypothetical protein
MRITCNTSDVYTAVIALTAILGKGTDSYDRVAATEDNREMLSLYLSAAVSEAEGELRRKLSSSHKPTLRFTDAVVELELEDRLRFDGAVRNLMASSLRLYLVEYVTASWLSTTPARELAEPHRESAAGYVATLADALDQREHYILDEGNYGGRSSESEIEEQITSGAAYSSRGTDGESIPEDGDGTFSAEGRAVDREIPEEEDGGRHYDRRCRHDLLAGEEDGQTLEASSLRRKERSLEEESSAGDYQPRKKDRLSTHHPKFYNVAYPDEPVGGGELLFPGPRRPHHPHSHQPINDNSDENKKNSNQTVQEADC